MSDPRKRIKEAIDGAFERGTDKLAEETGKRKTGFDPSVCEGCPERENGPLKKCGLCGCPTLNNLFLDQGQMTPEGCLRPREHEDAAKKR